MEEMLTGNAHRAVVSWSDDSAVATPCDYPLSLAFFLSTHQLMDNNQDNGISKVREANYRWLNGNIHVDTRCERSTKAEVRLAVHV